MSRQGRWVDFENDYKTMDLTFMESTWWAFKEIWNQDMVYRSYRVVSNMKNPNNKLVCKEMVILNQQDAIFDRFEHYSLQL